MELSLLTHDPCTLASDSMCTTYMEFPLLCMEERLYVHKRASHPHVLAEVSESTQECDTPSTCTYINASVHALNGKGTPKHSSEVSTILSFSVHAHTLTCLGPPSPHWQDWEVVSVEMSAWRISLLCPPRGIEKPVEQALMTIMVSPLILIGISGGVCMVHWPSVPTSRH
eukprot:scaffold13096_cov22-Tisochrysis_lutea.AAC.5